MAMKSYMSDKLRAKMSFTCAWSKEWRVSNFGGMKINKTIKRDTGRETQEVKKKHVNRIKERSKSRKGNSRRIMSRGA